VFRRGEVDRIRVPQIWMTLVFSEKERAKNNAQANVEAFRGNNSTVDARGNVGD